MEFKTPVGTPRSPGAEVTHMMKQLHLQRNVTKPASIQFYN